MTLQQIATDIAGQYDRHPNDLRKKQYSKLTNIHDMKKAFVKRCYENNIQPGEIASFLDHTSTSVSRLISRTDFKQTKKHKRIIQRFKQRDTLFIKPKNYAWIPKLREKGYCIVNVDKYTYKLYE